LFVLALGPFTARSSTVKLVPRLEQLLGRSESHLILIYYSTSH